jgi:hypothetical protein
MLRNITEAATIFSPPLKPSNFILSGREQNMQQTAVKTNLTLAANTFIRFKQNSNAANNIQSIGADMGGNTRSGVASGMRSVETHVQLSFG